jgi:hypothetical protein
MLKSIQHNSWCIRININPDHQTTTANLTNPMQRSYTLSQLVPLHNDVL